MVVSLSWSDVAARLYDVASNLFDSGDFSACFLVAYVGIDGFLRRADRDWLNEKLSDFGGVAVLDDLKRVHDKVLAGVRDVGEDDARLALDVLRALIGLSESSEEYVEVSSTDILVSLCFIGLLASFFVGGFPLWFDAVRIPLLALAGLYLFSRLVGFCFFFVDGFLVIGLFEFQISNVRSNNGLAMTRYH